MSGSVQSEQNDRSSIDVAGDLSVRDTNTPWVIEHTGHSEVLAIEVPRYRLESVLGSARHFTGLSANSRLPTTALARSFLCDLLRVGDQLTPLAAEHMTAIGIDLITASLAERMAIDAPRALRETLIVQRAKKYIAMNFNDLTLDSAKVAAASGVSLRRLQDLFRKFGDSVAASIWQQRLEKAAERLSDPVNRHISLSEVAFRCGFADQAHFSRRFRDQFGVSPREYRSAVLSIG
jgi:AraC-like DNA-binding protein